MRRPSTALLVLIWGLAVVFSAALIEVYAVLTGQPTISRLLQSLNDAAPVFGVAVIVLAGILLDHFFGGRE